MLINVKSEYNFLQSTCKIDDIVAYAVENHQNAIGICDYYSTMGSLKFYKRCQEKSIKAIIGIEVEVDQQSLLLYAKNDAGLKRLNEIISQKERGIDYFYQEEADLLCVVSTGPIASNYILGDGLEYQMLEQYFTKDNLYFGIISYMNDPSNYVLYDKLKHDRLKYIVIDQVRFFSEDKFEAYLTLLAIKDNKAINELKNERHKFFRHTVHKYDNEKLDRYASDFISKVNIAFAKQKQQILTYPDLKDGYDSDTYLQALVSKGLAKRLANIPDERYYDRMSYELKIIKEMGFSDYFLIVWDIIKFAHREKIVVGPGRGSAASSLVAYCLGITQIDPVKNDLLFERFLNPMRKTMPDIDMDFEDRRRDEVVDYIIHRFKNAAKIATLSKFLAKSAFRDVAKRYGLDPKMIEFVSKRLDSSKSMKENLVSNKDLQEQYVKNSQFSEIVDIVRQIEGLGRQTSIHAAGVIIANKALTNFCAINKENVAMLESKDLESIGLLKIDILALANLTFLRNLIQAVNKQYNITIDVNNLPIDDQKTYQLLADANTLGIFQMESPGIRAVLTRVEPRNFAEIANVLSLYRPGPMKYIDDYIKNKGTKLPNTAISDFLTDSYGIMIYQEQIMKVASHIAGYNLADADILRRAISKKDNALIESTRMDFVDKGCANGYKRVEVEKIFDDIALFAGYGFNKAHAYAYAMIVYQLAYIKANFPTVFLAQLFAQSIGGSKKDILLDEIANMKIKIRPPDIFMSMENIGVIDDDLILGISNISNINTQVIDCILMKRDNINNKHDFVETILTIFSEFKMTDSTMEALIDSGLFDRFKLNRHMQLVNFKNLITGNVAAIVAITNSEVELMECEDYSFKENSMREKKALGINFKFNLFEDKIALFKRKNNVNVTTIDKALLEYQHDKMSKNQFLVVFELLEVKEIVTKKNDKMAFLNVRSENNYDITVFSTVYQKNSDILRLNQHNFLFGIIKFQNEKIYLEKL